MQNVTEQHRIEALVSHRKMTPIVRQVVDTSGGVTADIQSHYSCAEHALQMMRDETVAAADVEHTRPRWQHLCYFEGHVVSAPDLTAPSHALDATFDGGS